MYITQLIVDQKWQCFLTGSTMIFHIYISKHLKSLIFCQLNQMQYFHSKYKVFMLCLTFHHHLILNSYSGKVNTGEQNDQFCGWFYTFSKSTWIHTRANILTQSSAECECGDLTIPACVTLRHQLCRLFVLRHKPLARDLALKPADRVEVTLPSELLLWFHDCTVNLPAVSFQHQCVNARQIKADLHFQMWWYSHCPYPPFGLNFAWVRNCASLLGCSSTSELLTNKITISLHSFVRFLRCFSFFFISHHTWSCSSFSDRRADAEDAHLSKWETQGGEGGCGAGCDKPTQVHAHNAHVLLFHREMRRRLWLLCSSDLLQPSGQSVTLAVSDGSTCQVCSGIPWAPKRM